jgi:capsular polysaccharide biosynthesis protein
MNSTPKVGRDGHDLAEDNHRAALEPAGPADRLQALWASKWWILGIAVVVCAATVVVSLAVSPTYQSSATVRVVVQPSGGAPRETVLASNDLASQYAQVADSSPVIELAAKRLGEAPGTVNAAISAGTVGDQNLVSIKAQAGDATVAQDRANAVARSFINWIRATNRRQAAQLETAVDRRLQPLEAEIARARTDVAEAADALAAARTPVAVSAASARLTSQETLLASLLAQRQQFATTFAQSDVLAEPSVVLVTAAGRGGKVQPKPLVYGIVAFVAAALVAGQLFALLRGSRRPARG